MKWKKKVLLDDEDTYIEFSDETVTYIENGQEKHLMPAQQKLLRVLADKVKEPVNSIDLYRAYNGKIEDTVVTRKSLAHTVSDQKGKLPDAIKRKIKPVYGVGYKLDATIELNESSNVASTKADGGELRDNDIPCDIVGFYLDPRGSSAVHGANPFRAMCIHCDKEKVWMIEGIMTLDMALEVSNSVFRDPEGIEENFLGIYEKHKNGALGGARILSGDIQRYGNLITFTGEHSRTLQKGQVIIDHTSFTASRADNRADGLRASISLYHVMHGKIGTYCTLMGLIRKDLLNSHFEESNITGWLKMLYEKGYAHNPICLNPFVDSLWYQCCMDTARKGD